MNANTLLNLLRKPQITLEKGGINCFDDSDTTQCPSCRRFTENKKLMSNMMVCPVCGHHYRLSARNRIKLIVDQDSFTERFENVQTRDYLSFPGYAKKLEKAIADTGETEAVVCGDAAIDGKRCAVFAMDTGFIMGSMGCVVGERITRLFEYATDNRLPVVGFTASGGARMQEGILSLMQMAKVSGAVKWHGVNGNLYITVLTDPTTGGVTASFAMLGDIIIAEPKALVGFAGKRVIEQTTKKRLPDDFQSAEMVQSCGFIDCIVDRRKLKRTLSQLLKMHERRDAE